jgi:hypothetical protein
MVKLTAWIRDNVVSKPFNGDSVNIRTLPYGLPEDDFNMTATNCINRCQLYGYTAAGIEVGTQCFCGDPENLLVASDPFVTTTPLQSGGWEYSVLPALVDPSRCDNYCSGSNGMSQMIIISICLSQHKALLCGSLLTNY